MKKFSLTFKITAIVLISFLVILSFEAYQGYNRYKNAAIKEKSIDNEYVDVIKNAIYNAAIDHKDLTIDQLKNEIINDTDEESKKFYTLYKVYDEDELEERRNNTKEQYILIADKDGNLINASGMSDIFFIHNLDYIGFLNDNNNIYININAKDIPRIVKTISDNWDNGLNVEVSTTNFEMTNDNIRIIDNPAYLKIGNEVIIDGAYKDIETIFIDNISSFFYKLEKNKPIDNYFLFSYPFFEKKIASKVTNNY